MANQKLKYLFSATFKKGLVLQDEEDKSEREEGRSQFYDVLKLLEEGDELLFFSLYDEVSKNRWGVNLKTGIFYHNGIEFIASSEQNLPDNNPKFELIYFRQVRIHSNFNNGKFVEEVGREVVYYFGWKCNIEGKVYQQLIGVN